MIHIGLTDMSRVVCRLFLRSRKAMPVSGRGYGVPAGMNAKPITPAPPKSPPPIIFLVALAKYGSVKREARKRASEAWLTMSAEEKQPLSERYAAQRKRYSQEIKEYRAAHGLPAPTVQPPRASTRYSKEQSGLQRKKWSLLTEEEKQPYRDAYNRDMELYKIRELERKYSLKPGTLDLHGAQFNYKELRDKALRISRSLKAVSLAEEQRPPRRPLTTFFRFQLSNGLSATEASQRWKTMSEEEKKECVSA
ncbi:hypothetical protein BXZ70DRAFT_740985 [Cristinia sonorae]|uniref:HMG box domain-containing protein n=1 Tax=Cristinia sonorae TaxID=1940300 RepID=A0A8K0XSA6_9AGAR|nr:hypothetical protein BXZ70DRAFT_740985 [Cristinia sonorae]